MGFWGQEMKTHFEKWVFLSCPQKPTSDIYVLQQLRLYIVGVSPHTQPLVNSKNERIVLHGTFTENRLTWVLGVRNIHPRAARVVWRSSALKRAGEHLENRILERTKNRIFGAPPRGGAILVNQ